MEYLDVTLFGATLYRDQRLFRLKDSKISLGRGFEP